MSARPIGVSTLVCVAAGLLGCQSSSSDHVAVEPGAVTTPQACFSPRGGCTQLIVDTLDGAKRTVLVQAYSFTSQPIAGALMAAYRRGVTVEVLADKSQRTERQSRIGQLADAGIVVLIDAAHAIAHNKVMVIDAETVITGSFNFTKAAEEANAENVLILRDHALARRYEANWRAHQAHAAAYRPASGRVSDRSR